jgi:hypothetical protein
MDTMTRFLSKIELKDNGCWDWKGSKTKEGYGRFAFNKIMVIAHRFSYEVHKQCIPIGMEIDHLCKNRSCVNPEHLEVVTHTTNIRRSDRWVKC